jgi:hypothetical protein
MADWSWQGLKNRALEFPRSSGVATSPLSRARIRYNEIKQRLEQSISGGAYTSLSNVTSSDILSQAAWYISTTGNDNNSGQTAATAIRTHAELMSRIAGQEINVTVTIHVLNNALATEDCHVVWNIGPEGNVRYLGYATSVLATGSITAKTDLDEATNVPFDITDAALSDSWTALGLVNGRLRITSGARAGAVAWVMKDLGAKKARVSQWKQTAWPITNNYPTVFPQIGDPYVVETLSAIRSLRVNTQSDSGWDAVYFVNNGRLTFDSFTINSTGFDVIVITGDGSRGYDNNFMNCDLRFLDTAAGAHFYNCRLNNWTSQSSNTTAWIDGGLLTGFFLNRGAGTLQLISVSAQSTSFASIEEGIALTLASESSGSHGGIGAFDSGEDGIIISGGYADVGSFIYGSGNTGYGIRARDGGRIHYSAAALAKMTIAGSVNDTIVGGTVKAYGALPFFNVANGSCIVQKA